MRRISAGWSLINAFRFKPERRTLSLIIYYSEFLIMFHTAGRLNSSAICFSHQSGAYVTLLVFLSRSQTFVEKHADGRVERSD